MEKVKTTKENYSHSPITKGEDLVALKLTDLHVHLGATTSGHDLWEIANEQGIKLPTKDYWDFVNQMSTPNHMAHKAYLNKFELTQEIQSSPYAIEKCVHSAISSAYRKSNITTIEIRFNPIMRNKSGFYDLDRIIYHACVGMRKACFEYPVKAGLIIECERSCDAVTAMVAARKAVKYKNDGIVGFDVSGYSPEHGFSVDKFVEPFKIAREGGLGLTFHTGEVTGAEEMEEVIDKISPDRIGHGVHGVRSRDVVQKLLDKDIVLELCPTSNMKLGVLDDIDDLHRVIDCLQRNGVKYCINSDGPVFLNVSVYDELLMMFNNKILNGDEIVDLTQKSHAYSFIEDMTDSNLESN